MVQKASHKERTFQILKEALTTNKQCYFEITRTKTICENKRWTHLEQQSHSKSQEIVLPNSLHRQAAELAHKWQFGIIKTKQLLRTKVWFYRNMHTMSSSNQMYPSEFINFNSIVRLSILMHRCRLCRTIPCQKMFS